MRRWGEQVLERLWCEELEAVREVPGVWVVGGAVRDALLGGKPRDLDLLVERPTVSPLWPADVVHERFGTFTAGNVNVAVARRERYPAPGALPEVTLGATVAEDLARRDFSINAMAVRVADGAEEAWPGAIEDLEAQVLRVLHDDSFRDDPTRLLRLVRYGARLGFRAEDHTRALAADAISDGALATVSGSRVGAEVRLLLREKLPAPLLLLAHVGLGTRAIHPGFSPDEGLLTRVLAAVPAGAEPGLAALGACLLGAEGVAAALDRLAFTAVERDIVAAAADAGSLAERLQSATAPSEVASVAARRPAEALAVAAALGAEEPVRRWLAEWRHVRAQVSGEDLLAAGLDGPAVGAGLRAALAAALDGRAPDRETQLAVALEAAR